jgi:26S proteasome regulatory subunit N3
MPGKTPDKEPVENGGYRGGKDIDMKDKDEAASLKHKAKKSMKDGDEEMTVVVPPSKASKQASAPPPNDADDDVDMDGVDKAEDLEVKIDPVLQAVNGAFN